ncbi:hypothetical protein BAE44_0025202 [Dichanthelium oligosanthes]|uniref:Uncharacterized protein n=1 Tax=Dichanthelium oligosanthes TaxID=888268 RepID=A0A1E5ULR8_9POAL|nr:hypothetical protein BAE44_0025202 [Dichanthelium oligosanthes]
MFEGVECRYLQQESEQPEQGGQDGEFVETQCGALVEAETTVEELLDVETTSGEGSGMPAAVTLTPPDDDFFVGLDPECGSGVQEEEQSIQMQQQQPRAEPDLMADFIQSLTPRGLGSSLWPNSPLMSCSAQRRFQASAAAMASQQQGSHWMQPLQLPFLMC